MDRDDIERSIRLAAGLIINGKNRVYALGGCENGKTGKINDSLILSLRSASARTYIL